MASATEYVTVRLTREEIRALDSAARHERLYALDKALRIRLGGGDDAFWKQRADEMEAARQALMRHE